MTNWLLLRGLTRDQRHWGQFHDELAARLGVRVVTIDPPGFGTRNGHVSPRSIAAITDDIRARFEPGDERWSLLGISLGGMMAMDWVARYPADFERCAVVNTAAPALFRPHQMGGGLVSLVAGKQFRSLDAHEAAALALSSNRPADELTELAATWARYQREAAPVSASALGQVAAAVTFRLPARIPVPLLVLTSAGDRLIDHRISRRLAARFDAPLRVHPDAGHDLPLDDGAWVCERIAEWLGPVD
ncbi:alpha/beta fold hydrolase [Nocardia sp. NPDC057668]|uniref:alpha/beta fold hydrolase n=1 Tax=Nocardia sp. NPDC057668 TaxID=3346202 RepID=UPI0036710CFF